MSGVTFCTNVTARGLPNNSPERLKLTEKVTSIGPKSRSNGGGLQQLASAALRSCRLSTGDVGATGLGFAAAISVNRTMPCAIPGWTPRTAAAANAAANNRQRVTL